jgi:pilus assembly protein CpaD
MKIPSVFFTRPSALALICCAAFSLSGCITDEAALDDLREPVAYSGSQAFPISVAKGPVTLEVSSRNSTLQPGQINAVQAFANQAASAGVTPITISRPSGGGASARVASEIAALMVQQGIPRNRIMVATHSAPSASPVILSYISTYAKTKECGQWPDDLSDNDMNQHMASHGCAVQANIAAMVADPNTLIVPTPTDPARAAAQVLAIKKLENPAPARSSFFSFF